MNRLFAVLVVLCSLALTGCVFPGGPQPVAVESATPKEDASTAKPSEPAGQASQPPSVHKVNGDPKALSATEVCLEWQGIFRSLAFGMATAEDVVMHALEVSAGAPNELKAESASAAEAIIYTMANKKLGDDLSSAEKVLKQLRAACIREAGVEIIRP